jgi:hypothetical protein
VLRHSVLSVSDIFKGKCHGGQETAIWHPYIVQSVWYVLNKLALWLGVSTLYNQNRTKHGQFTVHGMFILSSKRLGYRSIYSPCAWAIPPARLPNTGTISRQWSGLCAHLRDTARILPAHYTSHGHTIDLQLDQVSGFGTQ